MKTKMSFYQFVKPYSKGQITIPQELREYLGITSNDWLFLTIKDGWLMARPIKEGKIMGEKALVVKPKISFKNYLKIFSRAKGAFGLEFEKENLQVRKEVEERLKRLQF